MSDGLDVFWIDSRTGSVIGQPISMIASFGSVSLAKELATQDYDVLRRTWGYHDATVVDTELAQLPDELRRLLLRARELQLDETVLRELSSFIEFAEKARERGLAIMTSGP